ncbi:MAG: hypothetical protein AAB500_02515 [Patescibacteria group bacterium]
MKKRNKQAGIVTIELLIAFAILVLNMTAIMLLISGGQSIYVDSETNTEAITKAKEMLEVARADAHEDFDSVVPGTTSDDIYTRELKVKDLTPCKKDVTARVGWSLTPRLLEITFQTLLVGTDVVAVLGGDCDSDGTNSEWDNPITATSIGIGGQGATDIDVRNNFIYLTSTPSAPAKEDFFIYEFDPDALTLTERWKTNVSKGLNRVDAINGYAFVANNDTSNHLMVFDTDLSSPSLLTSASLPEMTAGIARSIFYYNDFVYIGTQYLACPPGSCLPTQNNELHVFDVSSPGAPMHKGSYKTNTNINDIVVRGDYAYLATSHDDKEVMILDVSEPGDIEEVGAFDAQDVPSGAGEDGTSLYLLGNRLYLGRIRAPSSRPDFYVLDITANPANPPVLGSRNLGMNPSGPRVTGIIAKGNLVFVGMDDPNFGLKILDLVFPSLPYHTTCTSLNFSENSTAMDFDQDFVFSANRSNDEIRVIQDQPSTCS